MNKRTIRALNAVSMSSDAMATILITGTSRGLGLALLTLYAASSSTGFIFATARSPTPPSPVAELLASPNGHKAAAAVEDGDSSTRSSGLGILFRRKSSGALNQQRPEFSRKSSGPSLRPPSPVLHRTSSSGSLREAAAAAQGSVDSLAGNPQGYAHDHCMAVLRDLESVLREFSTLVAQSRSRRHPPARAFNQQTPATLPGNRQSFESSRSKEFFEAAVSGVNGAFLAMVTQAGRQFWGERHGDSI